MSTENKLPECWGHRGASARFPENTLASFEGAIRDGVEGIESDVHVSKDDVVVMFHDPSLDRTTNYKGKISETNWWGPDGMEHARTKKEPAQSIPTFVETLALLMKPEHQHIKFDVDIKPGNDPIKLFTLMHESISAYPGWETLLAPRIVLGLWHPKFIQPAKEILPYCRRSCIAFSVWIARQYFWNDVDSFSIWFNALATWEGKRFRDEIKAAGKHLFVFTVNSPEYMMEVASWDVDVIITDIPSRWLALRSSLQKNYDATVQKHSGRLVLYMYLTMLSPLIYAMQRFSEHLVRKSGGPLPIVA